MPTQSRGAALLALLCLTVFAAYVAYGRGSLRSGTGLSAADIRTGQLVTVTAPERLPEESEPGGGKSDVKEQQPAVRDEPAGPGPAEPPGPAPAADVSFSCNALSPDPLVLVVSSVDLGPVPDALKAAWAAAGYALHAAAVAPASVSRALVAARACYTSVTLLPATEGVESGSLAWPAPGHRANILLPPNRVTLLPHLKPNGDDTGIAAGDAVYRHFQHGPLLVPDSKAAESINFVVRPTVPSLQLHLCNGHSLSRTLPSQLLPDAPPLTLTSRSLAALQMQPLHTTSAASVISSHPAGSNHAGVLLTVPQLDLDLGWALPAVAPGLLQASSPEVGTGVSTYLRALLAATGYTAVVVAPDRVCGATNASAPLPFGPSFTGTAALAAAAAPAAATTLDAPTVRAISDVLSAARRATDGASLLDALCSASGLKPFLGASGDAAAASGALRAWLQPFVEAPITGFALLFEAVTGALPPATTVPASADSNTGVCWGAHLEPLVTAAVAQAEGPAPTAGPQLARMYAAGSVFSVRSALQCPPRKSYLGFPAPPSSATPTPGVAPPVATTPLPGCPVPYAVTQAQVKVSRPLAPRPLRALPRGLCGLTGAEDPMSQPVLRLPEGSDGSSLLSPDVWTALWTADTDAAASAPDSPSTFASTAWPGGLGFDVVPRTVGSCGSPDPPRYDARVSPRSPATVSGPVVYALHEFTSSPLVRDIALVLNYNLFRPGFLPGLRTLRHLYQRGFPLVVAYADACHYNEPFLTHNLYVCDASGSNPGIYGQGCYGQALDDWQGRVGHLVTNDDALLNWWTIDLPTDKAWISPVAVTRNYTDNDAFRNSRGGYALAAADVYLTPAQKATQAASTGRAYGMSSGTIDTVFIPGSVGDQFAGLAQLWTPRAGFPVYVEDAVPTAFDMVWLRGGAREAFKRQYLWGPERPFLVSLYDWTVHWVHPAKLSLVAVQAYLLEGFNMALEHLKTQPPPVPQPARPSPTPASSITPSPSPTRSHKP